MLNLAWDVLEVNNKNPITIPTDVVLVFLFSTLIFGFSLSTLGMCLLTGGESDRSAQKSRFLAKDVFIVFIFFFSETCCCVANNYLWVTMSTGEAPINMEQQHPVENEAGPNIKTGKSCFLKSVFDSFNSVMFLFVK